MSRRNRTLYAARAAVAGWVAPLLATGLTLSAAPSAQAHMGSTKVVQATATERGAVLDVQVESIDAAVALGMGTAITPTELAAHGSLVQHWLARGLVVSADSGPCSAAAESPRFAERDGKSNIAVRVDYTCPLPIGALTLTDDTVFEDDPDHEVFVSVQTHAGSRAHVLRASARSVELRPAAAQPSTVQSDASVTATAFVVEGAIHLVTGYDHLLFVLSLVLAAGLIVRREGLRTALRDVAGVVTAFTAGHSLSLVACSLGWVSLPSQWVEAAIAASIVAVAGMNVTRPSAHRSRPWLAGAFGLIHGFGFSSVLADVGLPAGQRLVALLSFNVGIELAQLAFVAAVLLPLSAIAHHKRYRLVVMQGGSLAIATFGCIWLVERVWG